jgi:hypothetical protein
MQEDLDQHCHEHRYGSRQLADWMSSHFPDLGSELAQLQTTMRKVLTDLPPGGTQAESDAALSPSLVARADTALASPAGPEADVELGDTVRAARAADADTVLAEISLAEPTEEPARDPSVEWESFAEPAALPDAPTRALVAPRGAADGAETRREVDQQRKTTDPVSKLPSPAKRRRRLRVYLGLTGLFLCAGAFIVWTIGFGNAPLFGSAPLTTKPTGEATVAPRQDEVPASVEREAQVPQADAAGAPVGLVRPDAALPAVREADAVLPGIGRKRRRTTRRRPRRRGRRRRTHERVKPPQRPVVRKAPPPDPVPKKKKALGDEGVGW